MLAHPALEKDLAEIGLADPWRLAVSRQADDAVLRAFARGVTVHRDDRPVVEFWAPLEGGGDESAYQALGELGESRSLAPMIGGSAKDLRRISRRLLVRPWLLDGHRHFAAGREEAARLSYLRALRLDPKDPLPRILLGLVPPFSGRKAVGANVSPRTAATHLLQGDSARAALWFAQAVQLGDRDPGTRLGLALAELYRGRQEDALPIFLELVRAGGPAEVTRRAMLGVWLCSLPAPLANLVFLLTFAGL
jgi:tetratricopeptide (TPR) repeat protein